MLNSIAFPDYSRKTLVPDLDWVDVDEVTLVYAYYIKGQPQTVTISPDKTTVYTISAEADATRVANVFPVIIPKGWSFKVSHLYTAESGLYQCFYMPLITAT